METEYEPVVRRELHTAAERGTALRLSRLCPLAVCGYVSNPQRWLAVPAGLATPVGGMPSARWPRTREIVSYPLR
jgi:hypothetical protein